MRLILISLIGLVFFVNANSQNTSVQVVSQLGFHQLSPHSMSVSPDGRWLAFGRSSSGSGGADLDHVIYGL